MFMHDALSAWKKNKEKKKQHIKTKVKGCSS